MNVNSNDFFKHYKFDTFNTLYVVRGCIVEKVFSTSAKKLHVGMILPLKAKIDNYRY